MPKASDSKETDIRALASRGLLPRATTLLRPAQIAALAILSGLVWLTSAQIDVQAQTRAQTQAEPVLVVAEKILMLPKSTVPLPIQIDTTEPLPANIFLRLKNLPVGASLTEGYKVSAQTWAIPLDRLLKLRIRYPAKVQREATLKVQLVSIEGQVHAERDVKLLAAPTPLAPPKLVSRDQKRASQVRQRATDVMSATANLAVGKAPSSPEKRDEPGTNPEIRPAQTKSPAKAASIAPPPATVPQASPPPANSQAANPPATAAAAAGRPLNVQPQTAPDPAAQRFLAKGNQFLLLGNIGTARLFYRRAADKGHAAAAMALAATFDPKELAKLGIIGVPGDFAMAREWYKRAAQLGSPGADERLAKLPKQ